MILGRFALQSLSSLQSWIVPPYRQFAIILGRFAYMSLSMSTDVQPWNKVNVYFLTTTQLNLNTIYFLKDIGSTELHCKFEGK